MFDGVRHPNPTVSFVEDGLGYCDQSIMDIQRDYNFIISIGGGTNHDCAKAIATVASNGGSIIDYEGWNCLLIKNSQSLFRILLPLDIGLILLGL